MSILNYIKPVSLLSWAKEQIIDKTITYTIARQQLLDKIRQGKTTLAAKEGTKKIKVNKQSIEIELKENLKVPAPHIDTDHIWYGAFVETYGIHGLDLPSGRVTYSYGDTLVNENGVPYENPKAQFTADDLPRSLMLVMFLGLPTRVLSVDNNGKLSFNLRQFWHNLAGGWDRPAKTDPQKAAATKNLYNRIFLFPFKIIIAAYYTATFFIKFPFNVIKFFGLMLPLVMKNSMGKFTGYLAAKSGKQFGKAGFFHKVAGFFLGLFSIVAFTVHAAIRIFTLAARAFFTPVTSAQFAWGEGRAINKFSDSSKKGYGSLTIGALIGLTGVAMSLALSITLWSIAVPLAITMTVAVFPSLVPVVTSLSQIPLIAAGLTSIKGGFALAVGSLPAAFASAATWLASLVGLTLTAPAIAVGVPVAVFTIGLGTPTAYVADLLSNSWARWQKGGLLTWLLSAVIRSGKSGAKDDEHKPLLGSEKKENKDEQPLPKPDSEKQVKALRTSQEGVDAAVGDLDDKAKLAGKVDEPAVLGKASATADQDAVDLVTLNGPTVGSDFN